MNREDRRLLAAFERAHRLRFQERRLCRALIRRYGLDGSGPRTSPALIFFRPSWWDVFIRDALGAGDRRLRPEAIEDLRARLFAPGA